MSASPTEGTDMNQIEKALSDYLGEMCGMRLKPHALTGLAKAAIAAMQPAPQWQGIESAPRDWTDVLVFSPKHSGFNCGGVLSAFYDTDHPGWFAHGPGGNIPLTPTHWMPLPTPPAGGSDE